MSGTSQVQLGTTLCKIAEELNGAMNGDDFHYGVLIFLCSPDPTINEFVNGDVTP